MSEYEHSKPDYLLPGVPSAQVFASVSPPASYLLQLIPIRGSDEEEGYGRARREILVQKKQQQQQQSVRR
jgi:hypothetical protein